MNIAYVVFFVLVLFISWLVYKSRINGYAFAVSLLVSVFVFLVLSNPTSINELIIEGGGLKATVRKIQEDKREVFAARSTVLTLTKKFNDLAQDAEEKYLKNLLISQIESVMQNDFDSIGRAGKAIEMVINYRPNRTKDKLLRYLKGYGYLTPEISGTLDKLEEFYQMREKRK